MICSRCHNFCTFTIKLNKNQFSSVNIGCLCLQNKILFLNQFLILLHNKSTDTQSKGIGKCNIHTNKKYEYYCRTCNALQCQSCFRNHKFHDCQQLSSMYNSVDIDNITSDIEFFKNYNKDFIKQIQEIEQPNKKKYNKMKRLFSTYNQTNIKLIEIIELLYDIYISKNHKKPTVEMINLINFTNFNQQLKKLNIKDVFNDCDISKIKNFTHTQYIINDFSVDMSSSLKIEKIIDIYTKPDHYYKIHHVLILQDGNIAIGTTQDIQIYNSKTYQLDKTVNTPNGTEYLVQLSNGLLLTGCYGIKIWKINKESLTLKNYLFKEFKKDNKLVRYIVPITNNRIFFLDGSLFYIVQLDDLSSLETYECSDEFSAVECCIQLKGLDEVVAIGINRNIDFFDLNKREFIKTIERVGCSSREGMKELPNNKLIVYSEGNNFVLDEQEIAMKGIFIVNYKTFQVESYFYNFENQDPDINGIYGSIVELIDGSIIYIGSYGKCLHIDPETYKVVPFVFPREENQLLTLLDQRKMISILGESKIVIWNY